jgi:hypothetical protein
MFAAMRRASSPVISLVADRRLGSSWRSGRGNPIRNSVFTKRFVN